MQTDIYLVVGLVLAALAFPSLLNAYSESRFPRLAALLFITSGGLVVAALTQRPGGYSFADVPQAFIRVIGHLVN